MTLAWNDKLARTEEFVRDTLRLMGQSKDADDAEFVRAVAIKVAISIGRVKLPPVTEDFR